MFEFVQEVIEGVERDPSVQTREAAFRRLRPLGLDPFGELLLSMPNAAYPKLSTLLPSMASDQVQRDWTGDCGPRLLSQSVAFVRTVVYNYARLKGRGLEGATVLDFGCGYGRLLRLMYGLTDESNVYGVDPWARSIDLCRECGLSRNLAVSDYLPVSLPVGDGRFDLAYAFSVFTHLSQRAALAALRAVRASMKPDGVFVITIRPVEYWQLDGHTDAAEKAVLVQDHRRDGYAFKPHVREAVDGDVTYGDSSMTLEWIERNAPDWAIAGTDYLQVDPYQRLVFLTPR